jgi:hypothetical protein
MFPRTPIWDVNGRRKSGRIFAMSLDPESLYRQLGRLLETTPDFYTGQEWTTDTHTWVGRADALIKASGDHLDLVEWRTATSTLEMSPHQAISQMIRILHRALASAELRAPSSVRGTFIPVGNSFDAFAALTSVLQTAAKDVLIVDPYLDETALTEFGGAVPEGVMLRMLADTADRKPTLLPAATKWVAQYGGLRPLGVRLAEPKTLHDRAIFIDRASAWLLTQSIKDFAKRSPAEIVRANDTAALKIAAYEEMWNAAAVVV